MPKGPKETIELAHEANVTADCARQVELATNPNLIVRRQLARNPRLCSAAADVLGDELPKLRIVTKVATKAILEE